MQRFSQFDDYLLPCPFCGGEAEYDANQYCGKSDSKHLLLSGHAVYCADYAGGCIGCPTFSTIYDTQEEAFKAWNTRGFLEKLKQENEQYKAQRAQLLEALKIAKRHLINELEEPGRTVFWSLVEEVKKLTGDSPDQDDLPKPGYLGNINPPGCDPDVK